MSLKIGPPYTYINEGRIASMDKLLHVNKETGLTVFINYSTYPKYHQTFTK